MDAHQHSLEHDLTTLLQRGTDRRTSLRWLLAGASSLSMLGCGGGSTTNNTNNTNNTGNTSSTTGACTAIPEETGGPYPADGTNSNANGTVNVLTLTGIVRRDITSSINGATGVAAGVPLTIKLKLLNTNNSCASAGGFTVYLWHCDRDGNYSLYSTAVTNQNYLRGVQEADANGELTFTSIFPGCYSGRMPHVHFEVYPSLAKSISAANRIKTSQFTFPMATLNEVYAANGYSTSVRNLAQISYASDNIFSDGTSLQMTSVTGNATDGYVATLTVAISA